MTDKIKNSTLMKVDRKALIYRMLRCLGLTAVAVGGYFAVTIWVPWLEDDKLEKLWIIAPIVISAIVLICNFIMFKKQSDHIAAHFAETDEQEFERMENTPIQYGTFYMFEKYLWYPRGFLIVPYDEIASIETSCHRTYNIPDSVKLIFRIGSKKHEIPIVKYKTFLENELGFFHDIAQLRSEER
ncbi:MAG: hypothetical protein IKR73_00800 [Oscillospiraceae bacterium]|nr:hypothetical protein [Oscillospiraceae bacterium]